jgi:4-hydroxy-3-polyprenylbenzoate decarboxylase
MSIPALAELIEILAREGELLRIEPEVDADLELAAIAERMLDRAGPALFFDRVKGQAMPVVANMLATERRLCLALGIKSLAEFSTRWEQLADADNRPGWWERLKSRGAEDASPLAQFSPKALKAGVCQQVVQLGRDVNLLQLPALRAWPQETARSIPAGQWLAVDPESAQTSLGNSPLVILDRARLGVPWHPFSPLWHTAERAKERGEKLPIAVVLGGPPALGIFSRLPFPSETNLLSLTGLWNDKALNVVRCRTQPLDVPAEAEIVIEGYLDPKAETTALTCFVTPSGTYAEDFPGQVIEVTAFTHRSNAVWPAVVYQTPASELTSLGPLAQRLLLPELKAIASEIVDLSLPNYGTHNAFVFVSIRQPYPGAARRVANVVWGHAALMLAKTVVLVDPGVNLQRPAEVWQQVAAHADLERDTFIQQGPSDPFDFSQRSGPSEVSFASGSKLGIDATSKTWGKVASPHGQFPRHSAETQLQLARRWKELGLKPAPPDERRESS